MKDSNGNAIKFYPNKEVVYKNQSTKLSSKTNKVGQNLTFTKHFTQTYGEACKIRMRSGSIDSAQLSDSGIPEDKVRIRCVCNFKHQQQCQHTLKRSPQEKRKQYQIDY